MRQRTRTSGADRLWFHAGCGIAAFVGAVVGRAGTLHSVALACRFDPRVCFLSDRVADLRRPGVEFEGDSAAVRSLALSRRSSCAASCRISLVQ